METLQDAISSVFLNSQVIAALQLRTQDLFSRLSAFWLEELRRKEPQFRW